jgi:hypothetical protein
VRDEPVSSGLSLTVAQPEGLALFPAGDGAAAITQVTFQIFVKTNYGEEVYVCGSDAALGRWMPGKGVKLSTTKDMYPQWVGRVDIASQASGARLKYKYVIRSLGDRWTWEDRIADRELVPEGPELVLNDGRFNQAQRRVTYQKLDWAAAAPPPETPALPTAASPRQPPDGSALPTAIGGGSYAPAPGAYTPSALAQELEGRARLDRSLAEQNQMLQREVADLQRRRAVELRELETLRDQVTPACSGLDILVSLA